MSRGLIAERASLSLFILIREARGWLARLKGNRAFRWRHAATRTDRLLIAPQDLRTADPTRASEIFAGRYAFAGKVVSCDSRSPFDVIPPSSEWMEALAGFSWLRHLRAAESNLTRNQARMLVEAWMDGALTADPVGRRPEVTARRVISWLTHAPFLLENAEQRFYRRFLRSLSRQVRQLYDTRGTAGDGLPRLQVYTALVYAGLCMAGEARLFKSALRLLDNELGRQILPDGGHISRNPGALIDLLIDLLPLRQAFAARSLPTSPALINAIERMMPMLRFFRHGDGSFANFNGMGPTPPDRLATVLAYDDARGRPVDDARHSGYQRIEAGNTVLIMDTGPSPPLSVSSEAHAGCLSFEFSSSRHRMVVNCGLPAVGRDLWRHHARLTLAHSTLCVGNASSCRFVQSARMQRRIGSPVLSGPRDVRVHREESGGGTAIVVSHDGYGPPFGLVHERHIVLHSDGNRIDGEDQITPGAQARRAQDIPAHIYLRFHLHPSVRASRLTHRRGALLTLPNRDVWKFECTDAEVALEESVFVAGQDGPRRSSQIVVRASTRDLPRIGWSFARVDPAEGQAIQRDPQQGSPR